MKVTLLYSFFMSALLRISAFKPLQVSRIRRPTRIYMSDDIQQANTNLDFSVDTTSITTLMRDIESTNINEFYYTPDMKSIYFRENKPAYGSQFKKVETTPLLTDRVLTMSDKKNIPSYILETPLSMSTLFEQGLTNMYYLTQGLITTTILYTIIMIIINSVRRQSGGGSNPFMGGGGAMNPFSRGFSSSNDAKVNMIKANISLSSWAGSPEIFEECTEIVSYLKNATVYQAAGAEIPRGILLEGPPGTGKTLLAKAIASETDANFLAVSASEFIELFVGMGAARIRELFKKARENTPSIIFIDEIDSIGRQRGAGVNLGNDEREQTLNQLLAEMDGFAQNQNVLVIAATNRRDVLDSALLRPGRFDRILNVPLPDRPSRKMILTSYLQKKKVEIGINVDFLAEITSGFSGAQIKNLINEAAIYAARNGETIITQKNLEDALEKSIVGIIKKTDTRSNETLERVAIHELGHAIIAAKFKEYFALKKVTIQSTYSGAGGYTLFNELPEISEGGLYTKDLLKKRIIIALGGKAAERVFYGENQVSVGAIQDLKQANSIAQQMIGNYGMGNDLEVFYNENIESEQNPFLGRSLATGSKYSEYTKQKIDKEAMILVNDAFKEAIDIIVSHRSDIEKFKDILIQRKTISGEEFGDLTQ
jgi:cell division protease FtsH